MQHDDLVPEALQCVLDRVFLGAKIAQELRSYLALAVDDPADAAAELFGEDQSFATQGVAIK